MIAAGYDDYTMMAISGHSSTRMLARTNGARKIGAPICRAWEESGESNDAHPSTRTASEIEKSLKEIGGRREDRTPDLHVANATRATPFPLKRNYIVPGRCGDVPTAKHQLISPVTRRHRILRTEPADVPLGLRFTVFVC
jgi:hypothetical protein